MNTNLLKDRLKELIEFKTNARGRFAELEELTGSSANSWKSFWHGRQRPTSEMIEAICEIWPEYALWLATGQDDSKYGHLSINVENPSCNAAPYLRSRIAESKLARELLYKVLNEEKDDTSWGDSIIEKNIQKYLKSAHQIITDEHDPDNQYKKAMAKVKTEWEKREIEIDNQSEAVKTLMKSLKSYPWINKEVVLENLTNLFKEAEKERNSN